MLPASGVLPASRVVEVERLPDALAVLVPKVAALVEPVVEPLALAVVDAEEDEPLDVDPLPLDDPIVASGRPEELPGPSSGG